MYFFKFSFWIVFLDNVFIDNICFYFQNNKGIGMLKQKLDKLYFVI